MLAEAADTPEVERRRADGSHILSDLIFIGTGSSSGNPHLRCVMDPESACVVCKDALANSATSKNRRGNPSILVRYRGDAGVEEGADGETVVLIDVGKTFKQGAIRWFSKYAVGRVDGILITHEHADAMLGLDDVREMQRFTKDWRTDGGAPATPVFLSRSTYTHVAAVFPYLISKPDEAAGQVKRLVSQLDFQQVEPLESFAVRNLPFQALPIQHGADCICLGFAFGERERVVYLSDFSSIPPETMAEIASRPIHLLILDALAPDRDATTHIGMPTAIAIARQLQPTRTLLVGMGHGFGDHDATNRQLRQELGDQLDVQLAFDGLRLFVDL